MLVLGRRAGESVLLTQTFDTLIRLEMFRTGDR